MLGAGVQSDSTIPNPTSDQSNAPMFQNLFGTMDSHGGGFYAVDKDMPVQDSWIPDSDLLLGINVMDIFSGFVPPPEFQ
ncbi:hypothetical protein QQX98_010602 [Neonectria punicea]|uniref:Uncharacterized protein n=1 Tax=Neonectria punicea TaxID=979145 RepID=A0ABR1GPD7_9HYPO